MTTLTTDIIQKIDHVAWAEIDLGAIKENLKEAHSMNILIHVSNWVVSSERFINFHTGKHRDFWNLW